MWMKSYGVKVNTNTNNTPTHKRDDKKNQAMYDHTIVNGNDFD